MDPAYGDANPIIICSNSNGRRVQCAAAWAELFEALAPAKERTRVRDRAGVVRVGGNSDPVACNLRGCILGCHRAFAQLALGIFAPTEQLARRPNSACMGL